MRHEDHDDREPMSGSERAEGDRGDGLEPAVDPDGRERLAEERPDAPHPATRFDAGTGQGTVTGPPHDIDHLDRPILDGSTMSDEAEASVPNPHRGQVDPALAHRQPALTNTSTTRWLVAAIVAAVVVSAALFALYPWNPLWCSIGIGFALVALLAMLAVRATKLSRPVRLRVEAVLLGAIWLVPLAIFIAVLATSADEIW
ncbi:hypothetical protein [Leucobacter sp.]